MLHGFQFNTSAFCELIRLNCLIQSHFISFACNCYNGSVGYQQLGFIQFLRCPKELIPANKPEFIGFSVGSGTRVNQLLKRLEM